jgi:hypothetical protein
MNEGYSSGGWRQSAIEKLIGKRTKINRKKKGFRCSHCVWQLCNRNHKVRNYLIKKTNHRLFFTLPIIEKKNYVEDWDHRRNW